MIEMRIDGLAELERRLQSLPQQIKRGGVILRALRSAARLVRDEARRRAPVLLDENLVTRTGTLKKRHRERFRGAWRRPGNIRSNIIDYFERGAEQPTVIVRVRSRAYVFAPDGNARSAQTPAYWWLVEFGTSRTRARPFMRGAFEAMKTAAAQQIRQGLIDEIAKAQANPEAYAASQRPRRRR